FRAFWKENVGEDFEQIRGKIMTLLSEEDRLNEIVRLVGMEALADNEKLILEIARSIREDFLFQNAFDEYDAYTPLQKQYQILKSIISLYEAAKDASSAEEFDFEAFQELPSVKELANLKNYDADAPETFEAFREQAGREIQGLINAPAELTA
ncbi:MAG: V-type ATP synthase subunit A, partial [Candidatus Paceibacterota bacterium]